MRAYARATDPETSKAAAESLPGARLRASQEAVLRVLKRRGPCTDTELLDAYDRQVIWYGESPQSPSGIRTRRGELVDRGLVKDTGRREKLPSGRYAIVWAVA